MNTVVVKSKRISAVAYLRMSTDDQSLSPEQQRREVQEYADRNGYEIVRWYVDEGISASKGDERRLEYQQLLIDSSSGEWQAVLCWSTSRLTRNHPHEAAAGKKILRNNGVYLDTVKEGRIDWNTFEGVLKDTLFNLLDHKYSVDLGRDSLRGRRNTFLAGGYPFGSIPYGYAHLYVCGTQRRVAPRTEKTKNLRGWMHFLAVVEPEAEVVRRIFRMYVEEDKSMCAIARILNGETVPGPGRGKDATWTVQNVRRRLGCPVYVRISKIGNPQQRREAHNRIAPEERLGDWPAIVDRDLWERAQAKLQGNGTGQAHEGKSGALQGILRCGTCGHVLHKENPRKPGDRRGDKYRCASTARGLQVECRRWTVYEAEILPRVARELLAAVDEETRRLLEARPGEPVRAANGDALRSHLAGLEERIGQAAESFLDPQLGTAMRKALEARVEELTAEAEEARGRLDALQRAVDMGGVERFFEWWEQTRGQLLVLAGEMAARPEDMVVVKGRDERGEMVPVALVVAAGNGLAAVSLHETMAVESVGPFPVLADAGKVRALLKRMDACVSVYWRRVTDEERRARRKGRGHGCPGRMPEWVVDHARLEAALPCGFSDGSSVSAGRRGPCARGRSRRPASRGPSGSP